jgi:hypothetical protein
MGDLQLKIDQYYRDSYGGKELSDYVNYDFKFRCTDEGEHLVDIFDNKRMVMRATYEVLGCYSIACSIWVWGWSIDQIEASLVEGVRADSKKCRVALLDGKVSKDVEGYLYYLSNDTFFISYKNVDKLVKFGMYFTQSQFALPRKVGGSKPKIIEFVLIKKIIQEHEYKN